MSKLSDQLNQDLKSAMKAHQANKVSVLRLLRSAISYKQIDQSKELDDSQIIQVISKEIKKRRESIAAYQDHRPELAQQEQSELDILQAYMPEAISEEKINQIIDQVIARQTNASFGQIMGQVMAKLKGEIVDGKKIGEIIKKKMTT